MPLHVPALCLGELQRAGKHGAGVTAQPHQRRWQWCSCWSPSWVQSSSQLLTTPNARNRRASRTPSRNQEIVTSLLCSHTMQIPLFHLQHIHLIHFHLLENPQNKQSKSQLRSLCAARAVSARLNTTTPAAGQPGAATRLSPSAALATMGQGSRNAAEACSR